MVPIYYYYVLGVLLSVFKYKQRRLALGYPFLVSGLEFAHHCMVLGFETLSACLSVVFFMQQNDMVAKRRNSL